MDVKKQKGGWVYSPEILRGILVKIVVVGCGAGT